MKKVALGIPSHGPVQYATARSLWQLTSLLTARDIIYVEIDHVGDPDLSRARNAILAAFLRSEAERLLFVDTDVVFSCTDALRLLESKHDYVGANYSQKRIGGGMASTPRPAARCEGSLVEAEMLATGLLSLSRGAVQRLADASAPYLSDDGHTSYAIASAGVLGGRWASEDEAMCRRWQALGGVAWIDTSICVGHVGLHTFGGPQ